jgi:hypothetical protein
MGQAFNGMEWNEVGIAHPTNSKEPVQIGIVPVQAGTPVQLALGMEWNEVGYSSRRQHQDFYIVWYNYTQWSIIFCAGS